MPQAKRVMLSVQATPDVAGIRTAEFRGAEHTVIPCVALVEGVLWPANAAAPELALAEEFGRFPQGWNGRPVVFGHPKIDGVPVSASSPDVLEGNSFGQLFNTKLDGIKLKTEIWIDNALVTNLSEEAQKTVEKLKSGDEVIEVSTGMFTMNEIVDGDFDGEHFEAIWRNIVPDHLAVLPEGVPGACSIEDGCGAPRTNKMHPVMRACQLNANCESQTVIINSDTDEDGQKSIFQTLMEKGAAWFSFRDSSENLSDSDTRAALNNALDAVEDRFTFIIGVFGGSDDSGSFVYEVGFGEALFERTFAINDGNITIGADAVRVRPVTKFVPVEVITDNEADSTIQENAMNKEEFVNGLIANEATQYTDDDKEWLNGLDEEQLKKMSPVVNADAEAEAEATRVAEEAETARLAAIEAGDTPPVTTEAYIAEAPAEVQEVLNSGVQMHKQRKDALVTAIRANARNTFTEAQLEAKPLGELESIAALSTDISFEGGGANISTLRVNDDEIPPAPKLFDLNPTQEADAA
ncbi:hypothetical protein LCGC14_0468590 [marine sediment metagenome]|uniref:DUF2213 domain-containing protein n=1 Tax=marine sediment metagenome TaxID=412755 RepID=A0A0F9VLS6_9ZZZZ